MVSGAENRSEEGNGDDDHAGRRREPPSPEVTEEEGAEETVGSKGREKKGMPPKMIQQSTSAKN